MKKVLFKTLKNLKKKTLNKIDILLLNLFKLDVLILNKKEERSKIIHNSSFPGHNDLRNPDKNTPPCFTPEISNPIENPVMFSALNV